MVEGKEREGIEGIEIRSATIYSEMVKGKKGWDRMGR